MVELQGGNVAFRLRRPCGMAGMLTETVCVGTVGLYKPQTRYVLIHGKIYDTIIQHFPNQQNAWLFE